MNEQSVASIHTHRYTYTHTHTQKINRKGSTTHKVYTQTFIPTYMTTDHPIFFHTYIHTYITCHFNQAWPTAKYQKKN